MENWSPDYCNLEILKAAAEHMEIPLAFARKITAHYSGFIADTIRTGRFEGILLPYLGKIQPRLDKVQYLNHMKGAPLAEVRVNGKETKRKRVIPAILATDSSPSTDTP